MKHTEWIEEALREHERSLLNFASSMVGPHYAAEAVQETFLRLCQQEQQSVSGHLRAWLFSVCKNLCRDILRKRRHLMGALETDGLQSQEAAPALHVEKQQELTRIRHWMQTLPASQQEVLSLKFSSELSYKEIAEVMDMSTSQVGVLLHRAVSSLKDKMNKEQEKGGKHE
ncbi:MAG: sigma-70 family RNA polymerase sigma factor [Myxococcales bacterium]|nr:MAG: sigma-70 family RNA polymerase sigma factor [Myxococcales bacterium]